ncbi:hypothetical protein [Microbacterium sp. KR10-403]|uniref:hypothetical protein n=1 Tax=Microbacterium sp. KR10-403 TaxID=3158581 RepID=UPI0032E45F62
MDETDFEWETPLTPTISGGSVSRHRLSTLLALLTAAIALAACTATDTSARPVALPTVTVTATTTATPEAPVVVPGFPDDLQGDWCTREDSPEQECFSLTELVSEYPDAHVIDTSLVNGAYVYVVCVANVSADDCSMADRAGLSYFPVGVDWECDPGDYFTGCDPDYSSAHDPSVARLVHEYNHQQDAAYHDAPPMYRR